MQPTFRKRSLYPSLTAMLACAGAFALLGCSQAPAPASPEEAMQSYWDAVQLSDWQTTWSMEQAAATGADDPYHYYRRRRSEWPILSFELGSPLVNGTDAEVSVELVRGVPVLDLALPKKQSKIDRWTWVDDTWRHVETVDAPAPADAEAVEQSADAGADDDAGVGQAPGTKQDANKG